MNAAFISFTTKVTKDTKVSGMREGVTEVPSVIPAEAGIQVRWAVWDTGSSEACWRDEGADGYRRSPV